MIGGTGPPPPLGDHPNGINISYPDYSFDTDIWHEPPKETNESFINNDTMTLRSNNDTAYKTIGNATTWHRYITFGYHSYDHCFQFDTQWDECDTLKFIWHTYGAAIVARRNQSAFPVVLSLALAYPSQVIGPILLLVI